MDKAQGSPGWGRGMEPVRAEELLSPPNDGNVTNGSVSSPQLEQRVYVEKMEEARRNWLDNLRRRTYVDIRL